MTGAVDTHVADAVGRPDLVRLDDGLVCLRFETMKVLSADAAVRRLLDTGRIAPGDSVVDSSSGIYAYALALACHRHGLHCHIVGSTTVDDAARIQLELLGATLERMPPSDDLKLDQSRRVARIRELLAADPRLHWMRQYHDDVHYLGYRPVAQRLREALGPVPLTVVGGVGSGASTGGLARYLRAGDPPGGPTRLVGVQPFGSVTFGSEHVADPDIIIAGIGSSIPFGNVDHPAYDVVHWTGFTAALSGAVALLRGHAVFAGLSAGASYLAARWERARDPGRTVVLIAADTGHRYVDGVFARHTEAVPLDTLAPHPVTGTDELALPWSRMAWAGAEPPADAVHTPVPLARRPGGRLPSRSWSSAHPPTGS
ncbi:MULTISPECIES: pyridoxal-phosphate dependent enzyme [unclassified Pseudonocardia]|uniref:pyridoxal-phosphate dependent enzyme n=1 Tax=unclassified Pseudonocardia TaxID=2619320 RepID=UPI0002EFD681|nr:MULTISPECIES: pyridoxal-phosphate dependent enzyme [unclassified Pseudonocardia]ALL78008.1 cysteine synthase [Pseudonocardia sp. EC080610-09]ALL80921.1 cysteine synthase [Pseudonocardia sp. EC080619-01]OLM17064.1 Cysteine synthase [Pseudonocardia sp. Ae707_Ps1]